MVKKLQPKLRFRGFTDAWEQRKLGRICRITMGQSPKGQNYTNDFNQYILVQGNADIVDRWVQPRVWTKEVTKTAEAGDLILSVRAPVGVVAKTAFPIVLGRGVAGIKGGEYIYQFLFMLEANNYWKSLSSGSTFDSITKEQLIDLPVRQPASEQERNRIGKLLHILDSILAAEKRKLDLLQKKKTALLRQIFERKLRFKGYDNPWNRHKLGSITDSYSGGTPPVSDSSYYGGDIPFIRSAEIANESTELFITQSGLAASSAKRVKKGDVLYALYGANSGNASFAKLDGAINQAVLSIRAEKGFSNSFIMYWLQRSKNAIIGTFLQGGQGNLSGSIVKKLSIQTPRIDEQERIGLFFIKIDSLITAETRKLDLLIDKKKALLQKMFV